MSDFLSFSPSLIGILSYLDFGDLPNCYLTNRRIHDVIQTNPSHHPKPWIAVEMASSLNDQDDLTVSMVTTTKNLARKQSISPAGIDFYENSQVEKYYQEGQFRVAAPHNLNKVQQLIADLLYAIFSRYAVGTITLRDDSSTIKESIPVVCQLLLLLPFAKCPGLHVHHVWPGIHTLTAHLGSNRVHVYPSNFDNIPTLAKRLDYLPIFHTNQISLTLPQEIDSVEPIIDLIKKWQRGTDRLSSFSLSSKHYSPPPLSAAIVAAVEKRLERFEFKDGDFSPLPIHFGRQADNVGLKLTVTEDYYSETIVLSEFNSPTAIGPRIGY